jgi:thiamine-monophosphate kinase
MATVSDIGERKLIQRIMKHLTPMPNMSLPFWDDASAIPLGEGIALIINTDMLVWETDIPSGMTPYQAARKCVVMNFSDLAAKGVQPTAFMPNVGLPKDYLVKDVEEIAKGFEAGAREYDAYVVGGDTNEAYDVVMAGIAFGVIEEERLMKRSGAKPGDLIATTGLFGLTSAAFKVLLDSKPCPEKIKEEILNSVYMPEAKVKEGLVLSRTGVVTSCMDSSDGLAVSLHDLSRSTGLGYHLESLPTHPSVEEFAQKNRLASADLTLFGGEEYELVFTFSPENEENISKALEKVDCIPQIIGKVTEKKTITMVKDGKIVDIQAGGWDHFRT